MRFSWQKMAVVAAVVAAMMATVARGQKLPSCVSKLVPCLQYLNSTAKPSETCCGPLSEAAENELPCLCALYNNPKILNAFNITVDEALQLSRRCSITTDEIVCNTGALAPAPASHRPPASPGGETGSGDANTATWFVISGLVNLFLFWCSVLA